MYWKPNKTIFFFIFMSWEIKKRKAKENAMKFVVCVFFLDPRVSKETKKKKASLCDEKRIKQKADSTMEAKKNIYLILIEFLFFNFHLSRFSCDSAIFFFLFYLSLHCTPKQLRNIFIECCDAVV